MIVDRESLIATFPVDAGETNLLRGTRVKFLLTAGVVGLATAGAADLAVGVVERDWSSDTSASAPSQGCAVRLFGHPRTFIAASATTDAGQLSPVASGKVDDGIGYPYVAFKGAGAANEQVTGYKIETVLFAAP